MQRTAVAASCLLLATVADAQGEFSRTRSSPSNPLRATVLPSRVANPLRVPPSTGPGAQPHVDSAADQRPVSWQPRTRSRSALARQVQYTDTNGRRIRTAQATDQDLPDDLFRNDDDPLGDDLELPAPQGSGDPLQIPDKTSDEGPESPIFPDPLRGIDEDDFDFNGDDELDAEAEAKEQRRRAFEEHLRQCRSSVETLRTKSLSQIDLDISISGEAGKDYPWECDLDNQTVQLPAFRAKHPPVHVAWTASGLCHKPLYFQERALERYGHSTGPYTQPLLSAAHFFLTMPILPYKMGLRAPNECVYTLGHYRPGNCAPYLVPAVPFTWRAILSQAGATVGAAALLP